MKKEGDGFPRQCEHWLGMTPLRGVGRTGSFAPYGEAQGVLADNADNIGNQHKST